MRSCATSTTLRCLEISAAPRIAAAVSKFEHTCITAQAGTATPVPKPEEAQRALARVQALLETEQLVHRQHLSELNSIVDRHHRAAIAYVLEALPPEERIPVWTA
jgi:hypothetical protein